MIEAALFVSSEPLSIAKILGAFEGEIDRKVIKDALDALQDEYEKTERAFQIVEIAGGYQLCTRTAMAPYLDRLKERKKKTAVSEAGLETLAIIAYRQPISRQDVEVIRGVNVSGVVHTLLERRLIKIVGRSEAPGRPFLYGTTQQFLEYFGLGGLKDLPDVAELSEPLDQPVRPAGESEGIDPETLSEDSTSESHSEMTSSLSEEPHAAAEDAQEGQDTAA